MPSDSIIFLYSKLTRASQYGLVDSSLALLFRRILCSSKCKRLRCKMVLVYECGALDIQMYRRLKTGVCRMADNREAKNLVYGHGQVRGCAVHM